MTLIGIIGAIAAFGLGIYWGLPRPYAQSLDEIDERLGKEGKHQKVRRHTTFLNLLQKKASKGSDRRMSRSRRPFSS